MAWTLQRSRLDNGLVLPYAAQGDPGGVPVVLVHGYADSWRIFEPLLAHLPASIRAFALTLRGHGDADSPPAGYALADMAGDVAAFMDAVELDNAILAGASSGGYIAQQLAVAYPDRVRGLVLIGSPRSFQDKPAFLASQPVIQGLTDPIDPRFVQEFGGEDFYANLSPDAFERMVNESLKVPAHVWKAVYEGFRASAPPSGMSRISAPTLILWGDRDSFIPRHDQEALQAAIPRSRLVVYEGAGHLVAIEQPARVAQDLVAFVAQG